MTEKRKKEVIKNLMDVYNNYESPNPYEPEMSLFDLISGYNRNYDNKELIGGDWVIENCPEPLKSLR